MPQTLEEWLKSRCPKTEELSPNETPRREIARKHDRPRRHGAAITPPRPYLKASKRTVAKVRSGRDREFAAVP